MSDFVRIELLPLGKVLRVKRRTPLQDVLFAHGVEFPCGGRGRCKGCRIKVLAGSLPITEEDKQKLTGGGTGGGLAAGLPGTGGKRSEDRAGPMGGGDSHGRFGVRVHAPGGAGHRG